MTKHTHTGTCQLCGRNHAVNNATGLLAKHGYTVDWGFFHGVCEGANHLPLQKDRSLLDSTVDQCSKPSTLRTPHPDMTDVPS